MATTLTTADLGAPGVYVREFTLGGGSSSASPTPPPMPPPTPTTGSEFQPLLIPSLF